VVSRFERAYIVVQLQSRLVFTGIYTNVWSSWATVTFRRQRHLRSLQSGMACILATTCASYLSLLWWSLRKMWV